MRRGKGKDLEKRNRKSPGQCELIQIVRTVQKSPKCRVNRIQPEWRSVSGATPVFVWIRSWL